MNSIIEEIYYGSANPSEFINVTNEDYNTLSADVSDLRKRLSESFNEETKITFLNFLDKHCEKHSVEKCCKFIEGFRLGAKIMLDVMKD